MDHSEDTSAATLESTAPAADPTVPEAVAKQRLRLWLKTLRCTTRIENHLRQRLRTNFGITLPQFDLLAALDRAARPMTMSELSKYLLVSNGNVTGVVQRLATEGWVELHRTPPDRRTQRVLLTQDGGEQFTRMAETHRDWVSTALSHFDLDEIEILLRLLSRVRKAEQSSDTSSPNRYQSRAAAQHSSVSGNIS